MQFLEGARNQNLSLEDSSASAWLCVGRGLVVVGALLHSTNGRASRFCFEYIVYSYQFHEMNLACRLQTEFAPFQRVPKPSRRRDPRAGTIDKGKARMCTAPACTTLCPPHSSQRIHSFPDPC